MAKLQKLLNEMGGIYIECLIGKDNKAYYKISFIGASDGMEELSRDKTLNSAIDKALKV